MWGTIRDGSCAFWRFTRLTYQEGEKKYSMDRWTGIVKVSLRNDNRDVFFKVAISLLLRPSSKSLAVPSANAIFFNGDQVKGTGNPVIERLSDLKNIAEILASKLGASFNIWVFESSTFNGPFAIYKEFVPSVNSRGEPKYYDPHGFPASSCMVEILKKIINQVNIASLSGLHESSWLTSTKSAMSSHVLRLFYEAENGICPSFLGSFLLSISQIHYVDVGLNCCGAYLTDEFVIKEVAKLLMSHNSSLRFVLHGTPRQWYDTDRPWICREKDALLQALRVAKHKCEGRLQVVERLYFTDMKPSLQMHFGIIESMDVS
ncbi:hypothetical protein HPP92_014253 [Vanilla planifolia]|uniref:Uncharacterized protein n=1 Tax=Vanilla planifolia TaxID=51239 RepID=A0A835QVG6_VANPL|nr:hypothetical protein HPP92_014253 [Vanilla planifolia]